MRPPKPKVDPLLQKKWYRAVRLNDCKKMNKLLKLEPIFLTKEIFTRNIQSYKVLKNLYENFGFKKAIKPRFVCEQSIIEHIYGYNYEEFSIIPCLDINPYLNHSHTELDKIIIYGDIYKIDQCVMESQMFCREWRSELIYSFICEIMFNRICKLIMKKLYNIIANIVMEYYVNDNGMLHLCELLRIKSTPTKCVIL